MYWISFGRTSYVNWATVAFDIIGLLAGEAGTDWNEETGQNSIYEVALSSVRVGSGTWTVGNNGNRIASATTGNLGQGTPVTAVSWKDGARVSIFYWDNISPGAERPSEIKEIRWIDGQGWVPQQRPSDEWKNFNIHGALSAVSYKASSGEWFIDLYAKWDNECIWTCSSKQGLRMVRFTASNSGWTSQSPDLASVVVEGTRDVTPMSAVAWYYNGVLNQRMYFAKCQNDNVLSCGTTNMHETSETNRDAWVASADFDD